MVARLQAQPGRGGTPLRGIERRLRDLFAKHPEQAAIQINRPMDFDFMYLLEDGVITSTPGQAGMMLGGTLVAGMSIIALTE